MDFLPINIRIADRKILIVGGGRVATHKAQILRRFTDRATVVAPELTEEIKALGFDYSEKTFDEGDLEGVDILFVCTGDHELNRWIKEEAAKRRILTSVCDDPEQCDFTSPAIYRRDNITIAVASDAQEVKRSIRIRDRIKRGVEDDSIQID
ncbi:MAG: bifunctional precorrin-2 dehydrogenase/sirohydrochlorin ferrochelatase [Bacteroidales bacterium]|nr:bifunctional precorrin-2 dehydrogenase/sirohydrochlorin ferrochelatase [Bacteroidales bacterium]